MGFFKSNPHVNHNLKFFERRDFTWKNYLSTADKTLMTPSQLIQCEQNIKYQLI